MPGEEASRRRWRIFGAKVAVGLLGLTLGWVFFLPTGSRPYLAGAALVAIPAAVYLEWRRGRMDRFVDVCGVDDVADRKGLGLTVDGLGIAVFRDGDKYHALLGRCPHADAPMGRGWVEEGEAVCPIHQWRFQLSTGRCTTMPGRSLHKFRCKVIEGRVWVEI